MPEKLTYVECDVPEGMTLAEYRRAHSAKPKRRRWWKFCANARITTAWMHW
jgi:hypothetical protein